MRGSLRLVKTIRKLPKGQSTWQLIISLGRAADGRYKQRWVRVTGTKEKAEARLNELLYEVNRGEHLEPSKMTVGQYLDEWLNTSIRPRRAVHTITSYEGFIRLHLKPHLGEIPLQKLNPLHVERMYATSTLAPRSLMTVHAILATALKAAVNKGMLRMNAASRAGNKPVIPRSGDSVLNVWSAEEARRALRVLAQRDDAASATTTTSSWSAQDQALFALFLDSGARKCELLGLQWKDLDLGAKLMKIERQLLYGGAGEPTFIPPKRGAVRQVDLSGETIQLLRTHKRQQAEVKIANRTSYKDYGLVFCHEVEHVYSGRAVLGAPLHPNGINRRLAKVCSEAGIKQIKVHGLRHTCATLLLLAGIMPHVVQRRLGHRGIEITLGLYSHVLPGMQADAAAKLAGLLHG